MKNVFLASILFLSSCSTLSLVNVSTKDFTYQGTDIYYKGELCAQMGALEIAYDGGKIVREMTYIVTDEKFNDVAMGILKYVRERRPSWEVEVELKKVIKSLDN
jgi:major membrane immunogen (membrane-anchored lipoprotein)